MIAKDSHTIACRLTSAAAGLHRSGVRACRYSSRRPPHVIVVSSNTMAMEAVAVAPSMAQDVNYGAELPGDGYAWRLLAGFRGELYRCLTRRGDALFGLADAVLCGPGRVSDLARLSLAPECGRGHG